MAMERKVEAQDAQVKKRIIGIIALSIILILIVASMAGYLLWIRPWAHASGAYDLSTHLTASDNPQMLVWGKVFNTGYKDGYATLSVTISDHRGYSLSNSFALGRVESRGGYVNVSKTYDWPYYYKNYSISNALPVSLAVTIAWVDAL